VTLLVTGANGQLGRALQQLAPHARFTDRRSLDIADGASVSAFDFNGVTAIVNAAAWTGVDAAEDEPLTAFEANATGVTHLAIAARRLEIPLVQVSTDYVFPGTATTPIPVDAPVSPLGAYGATKAAGEAAAALAPRHLVVRTSWVYGDGHNFVRTMRRLAATRDEVSVVCDQLGRPTNARDLAAAVLRLLDLDAPAGTYHATGTGDVVSWADVAVAALAGTTCQVRPITTAEYGAAKAQRPAYSALAVSPEVEPVMRDWRVALAEFLSRGA
jgi:dTDP-4-dehydrorhamnose reductase